ncbi:MAG: ribosomal-processing cysteine protease Prp [Firmicutes bacterium]|nr:ribosomal-processing cysteine protease Prp [Bacillota bacterium]
MTEIKLFKQAENYIGLECSGHIDRKINGSELVCAALSAIVQTALLGVIQLAGVNLDFKRDDKKGYLKFLLPQTLTKEQQEIVNIILKTCMLGVSDLAIEYSDFMSVEVVNK